MAVRHTTQNTHKHKHLGRLSFRRAARDPDVLSCGTVKDGDSDMEILDDEGSDSDIDDCRPPKPRPAKPRAERSPAEEGYHPKHKPSTPNSDQLGGPPAVSTGNSKPTSNRCLLASLITKTTGSRVTTVFLTPSHR